MDGTFSLDVVGAGTVALTTANDFSFTLVHNGNTQTFDDATTALYDFNVTLDQSGVVTSLRFDGDVGDNFLDLKFDLGATPDRANSGSSSQLYNYSGGRVFLDNVTVVPEPATMGLLALGGLMLRRRKRA